MAGWGWKKVITVRRVVAGVLLIGLALALDAFWFEPAFLRVTPLRLVLERPDAIAFDKLRIAIIADIHAGAPYIGRAKLRQIVDRTNAQNPDVILLAGDFVTTGPRGNGRRMPLEEVAALLKPLRAPLGVYALIGNHDRWDGADHAIAVLSQAGFTVLENESRMLRYHGRTIHLAGIGDFYTHGSDVGKALSAVPRGVPVLCVTHSPDVFPLLPESCFLTLAGHTHGGQVVLPIVGRLIVPSRYGRRYAAGLIHENGRYMFVSTGVGTVGIPVRFGTPSEISIVELNVHG